jgi:molecular chaperone DnaK (HSP70)
LYAEVGENEYKSSFELLAEPEAAVLSATHDDANLIGIGDKVMVIDIGGGTTDITIHEICERSRLSI